VIELRDGRRIGDRRHDHRPSLVALTQVEDLDPRRRIVERAEVARDVGDIGEVADRPRHISEHLQGRRDSGVGRQMVGQLGVETRLGGQLTNLCRVSRVYGLLEREKREGGVYHATFSGMRDRPSLRKSNNKRFT